MAFLKKIVDGFKMKNQGQNCNGPHKDLTILEAEEKLKRTNELANIANKTTDREEFYNSINEIKSILRELARYEGKLPFIGSPSTDLRNLEEIEQKQIDLLEKRIKESKMEQEKSLNKYKNTEKIYSNYSAQYLEHIEHKAQNEELNMLDSYVIEAGYIIIEKDMASIGIIQRTFKIGFNRAARIMDILEDMRVVGEETGTRPRKILVTREEYEQIIEEYHPNDLTLNFKSEEKREQILSECNETPENAKYVLKEKFGINVDYLNDGDLLKKIKNIIIPSTLNDVQIEFINILLKYNSPLTMKLILIDDSIITFAEYNGIPQLLIPVVTDVKKIDSVVNWCSSEMQNRMQKFVSYKVKNIDSYNEKAKTLEENTLPKIIIIVNETNEFSRRVSTPLERIFMNCNMVGMYFILFSRFSLKNLSLGMAGELLEVYTPDKLRMLMSQSTRANDEKLMTRNFDDMDGHQFEHFCADILRKNGFKNVEVTQGSGDHGIDILAEKDDITYAIQCKRYDKPVGNDAVQQAIAGKVIYNKDIAVVMTNRYFTPQAIEEAETLGVKLWDRDKLNDMFE